LGQQHFKRLMGFSAMPRHRGKAFEGTLGRITE
jgi:hypothetical protein